MSTLSYDFDDAVAIVTGAARGVGREIVRQFVAAGARVVAADRDEDGLAGTCADHGDRVTGMVDEARAAYDAWKREDGALAAWLAGYRVRAVEVGA